MGREFGNTVNELALISIGLLFGIVLAVVTVASGFLFVTAARMRRESNDAKREVSEAIRLNTLAIDKMRGEVGLALSQMDAQRIYESSVAILGARRELAGVVTQLKKIVYAVPGEPSAPTTPGFTLEEEAADDARMIAERNRWNAQQTEPIDPEQVNDYFAKRRRSGVFSMGSTPPAESAFAEAVSQQPERGVETLPDLGDDELSGQGEL